VRDAQRQAVLDAARYLREVRPLDPAELQDYVPDRPHPAAVRQVLRENAVALSLLERRDGTFVPVDPGAVDVAVDGDVAVPTGHLERVEDLLVAEFGPEWATGESGDELRERIRAIKERYLAGAAVDYDYRTALGYAVYHFAQSYASARYVLADLAAAGHLPRTCRVLDVGAGVGGPALALADLFPAEALVDYHAVEPGEAAAVLKELLSGTGRNFHADLAEAPIEAATPEGPFDVVLCANVLSELADPSAVATDLLERLAPDGTFVGIAPADRNTATLLRTVERHLERAAGATVYAPTLRLWPGETPTGECWSFDRKPNLAVPDVQARLDEGGGGTGEFVNVDVQYAYALLRTDGETALEVRPDPDRYAKMADAEGHVTDRIDCVGVKLSQDLAGGRGVAAEPGTHGGNPLFLLGDGSERVDHFAVLTAPSALNRDLLEADYGAVLHLENALLLWNDDEGAYNLVVDGETVVETMAE